MSATLGISGHLAFGQNSEGGVSKLDKQGVAQLCYCVLGVFILACYRLSISLTSLFEPNFNQSLVVFPLAALLKVVGPYTDREFTITPSLEQ